MRKFFVVTTPGFEDELEKEIRMFHCLFGWDEGLAILSSQKGGVEFESPVDESVYLNHYTKLATRVLVRWDQFHCVFFSDLEKKLRTRTLAKWFKNKSRIFVKVNSRKSKLGQEKKIFEVFKRVYTDFELIQKASDVDESDFTLFVDFFKDMCTLSIDTSGAPLYKRSLEKQVSFGSMRETIAQWALLKIQSVESPWKEPTILVDPYAGSGTLLLESQNFGLNKRRDFLFTKLKPFFELRGLDDSKIKLAPLPFQRLIGIESDAETFQVLESNTKKLERVELYRVKNEDFAGEFKSRVWVFSNLPYGKQVKGESLKSMILNLKAVFKPQLLAVFHPEVIKDKEAQFALHFPVINGGLKVNLSILTYTL